MESRGPGGGSIAGVCEERQEASVATGDDRERLGWRCGQEAPGASHCGLHRPSQDLALPRKRQAGYWRLLTRELT